jgi:hypothetical protein
MLKHVDGPVVRGAMDEALYDLESRVRAALRKDGPVHLGFDYLVVAEMPSP